MNLEAGIAAMKKERSALFDNIKALMLILVAVGHTVHVYIPSEDSLFRYIMQYIYLIHMPVFSFVTGFFSKNPVKARSTAVRSVLVPYVSLQGLYCVMAVLLILAGKASFNAQTFRASVLLPTSPLYYLLCVFFWKVFLKDLSSLRFPIASSVIMGVLISLVDSSEYHIAYGSVFSLMPFFLLGFYCTREQVDKIRRIPRIFAVCVLVLAVAPAVLLPYSFRNTRFTYRDVSLGPAAGMGYRLLYYMIAFCMIAVTMNLAAEKRTVLSRIGENALIVYAGSSFLAPHLYILIANGLHLADRMWLNLACIVLFSVLICFLLSFKWEMKLFLRMMGLLNGILFRDGPGERKCIDQGRRA